MGVVSAEVPLRGAADARPGSTVASIQQRGSLRVAVCREIPGFCYSETTEDEIKGFEVDLADILAHHIFGGEAKSAHTYVELVGVELSERDELVSDGAVDAVLGNYADTSKRRQFADFAGHYVFSPQSPLLSTHGPSIKTTDDLKGMRAAVVAGTADADTVVTAVPGAEVVELPTANDCFYALAKGDVQAFWANVASNSSLIKQRPNDYTQAPIRHGGERWGFGVRKGDEAFTNFIDDVVTSAFASGEINQSLRRWLG